MKPALDCRCVWMRESITFKVKDSQTGSNPYDTLRKPAGIDGVAVLLRPHGDAAH